MESSILTPALFIHQNHLRGIRLIELEGNNRGEKSLSWWEQKVKDAVSHKWGNSHVFLQTTLLGHYFRFSIHASTKYWEIHVWDMSGSNSICNYQTKLVDKKADVLSDDLFSKIVTDCEDFIRGIQICSGCQAKIKQTEIAGQYFAGRYCKKCWDTKYRAIEAAESYE